MNLQPGMPSVHLYSSLSSDPVKWVSDSGCRACPSFQWHKAGKAEAPVSVVLKVPPAPPPAVEWVLWGVSLSSPSELVDKWPPVTVHLVLGIPQVQVSAMEAAKFHEPGLHWLQPSSPAGLKP